MSPGHEREDETKERAVVTRFCRGRLVGARPWRRGVSPCEEIISWSANLVRMSSKYGKVWRLA